VYLLGEHGPEVVRRILRMADELFESLDAFLQQSK
jgi:hypothetical protein